MPKVTTMKGLSLELKVVARETEEETTRLLRGAAMQMLTGLVLNTPVDTGRARGNWLAGINQPVDVEAGVEDPSGGITIARGQLKVLRAKFVDDIWLSNNVPYIVPLNDRPNPRHPGSAWSSQAPLQWMENEVEKVKGWFERKTK